MRNVCQKKPNQTKLKTKQNEKKKIHHNGNKKTTLENVKCNCKGISKPWTPGKVAVLLVLQYSSITGGRSVRAAPSSPAGSKPLSEALWSLQQLWAAPGTGALFWCAPLEQQGTEWLSQLGFVLRARLQQLEFWHPSTRLAFSRQGHSSRAASPQGALSFHCIFSCALRFSSGRTIKSSEFQVYIQKNRNVMFGSLFYHPCLFSNTMLTAFQVVHLQEVVFCTVAGSQVKGQLKKKVFWER